MVELVLGGRTEAFEPLVTPYRRLLLTLAYRLCRNVEEAKEMSQETLLRAFRYLGSFDRKRSFKNWLLQIEMNVWRTLGERAADKGTLRELAARNTPEGPEERLAGEEAREKLLSCLDGLSPREREVFLLRDIEGRSVQETAEVLRTSAISVRVHLSRARVKIRAALDGIRAVAGREILDWPEAEWEGLMAHVRSEKPAPRPVSRFSTIPRKAWAYGLAIVLVLGIAAFIMRNILSSPPAPLRSELIASTLAPPLRSLKIDEASSFRYPRDVPFRVRGSRMEPLDRAMLAAGPASEKTTQNLMSMTLVSQETSLKVHWTFNRNFEWKEKKP